VTGLRRFLPAPAQERFPQPPPRGDPNLGGVPPPAVLRQETAANVGLFPPSRRRWRL